METARPLDTQVATDVAEKGLAADDGVVAVSEAGPGREVAEVVVALEEEAVVTDSVSYLPKHRAVHHI